MYFCWLLEATIRFDIATFLYLLEPFENEHLALVDPVSSNLQEISCKTPFKNFKPFVNTLNKFWKKLKILDFI